MTVLQPVNRLTRGWPVIREAVFPVLAVAMIVGFADDHIPMGLPGHRGLIWLTLLVAVTLTTHRRETVLAVGAASTVTTLALHLMPGPIDSARYLAAAALLYMVAALPVVRRHRWLLAVAAAPIHLVALGGAVTALLGGGYLVTKALFHLGFGLAAGLLGLTIAASMNRRPPPEIAIAPDRH